MNKSWIFPIVTFDKIVDGDTIKVTVDQGLENFRAETFRLAKINAPEMKTEQGPIAKQALIDYIAGNPGEWTIQTYKNKDNYGRRLGTLRDPQGNDVNKWMVTNGYAVDYMVDATP